MKVFFLTNMFCEERRGMFKDDIEGGMDSEIIKYSQITLKLHKQSIRYLLKRLILYIRFN